MKYNGDFKVAKKNIKAIIVMTKDKDGKLIPAENSVRFHRYLDGPPYFDKKYNAVYIEDKIKLYHNYFEKLNSIIIDSIKDGHCAEYKADLCEYTLFGPNAGRTRNINENGLFLYHCTIPKGSHYREYDSGELIATYVLGEEYEFPKVIGDLNNGDKVWFGYYYLGHKDRGFRVFPEERTIHEIEKHFDKNSYYSNYATIRFSPDGKTYYINDGIYHDVHVDYNNIYCDFIVISLTKEGLIDAYVKKFGERIKDQLEVIEEAQGKIDEINGLIDKIKSV